MHDSYSDHNVESNISVDELETRHKDKIPKKRCFLRALGQKKIKWDLFIMFLATVNWFQVPYNVSFTDVDSSNIYADFFNIIIDLIFMLDVVVNFRTSVIFESTAQEWFDNKKIAMSYLRGRFWIDFVASIPFDILPYIFPSTK
jgi:hypothetical protein